MSFPCQGRSVPRMHILKRIGASRVEWFIDKKHQALTNYIHKDEAKEIFFEASAVIDLINEIISIGAKGLRIYFATYSDDGNDLVPIGKGNLLTLIFVPTDANDNNMDYRYLSLPPIIRRAKTTEQTIVDEWINNYNQKLINVLNSTVPYTDGDTSSVFYEFKSFEEFRDEILCQNASGVRVYFASYTDTDQVPDDNFRQRLITTFILTKRNLFGRETNFHIENVRGFRRRIIQKAFFDRLKVKAGNFDTGSPCPPAKCPN